MGGDGAAVHAWALPKKPLPDLSPQVAVARLVHPKGPCGSGTRLPALLTAGWHQEGCQKSKAGSPPGHHSREGPSPTPVLAGALWSPGPQQLSRGLGAGTAGWE